VEFGRLGIWVVRVGELKLREWTLMGFWGTWSRVEGSGFMVWGLGLMVPGIRSRAQDLGFEF
jgi:hypothetical protein